MTAFKDWWKANPAVRFAVRTIVVAVVAYLVNAYRAGDVIDGKALLWGALVAAGTALVGLLSPVEPKVGLAKTDVQG